MIQEMPSLAPSDTMQAFIELVKERMRAEDISIRDLAERCGINESALSRLLSGKSGSARTATIDQIADGLGMRVGITLSEK